MSMTNDDLWLNRYLEICAELPTDATGGPDHPSEFDRLGAAEQAALLYWIRNAIEHGSSRSEVTSYGIKHHFEYEGFYVTNGAFKGAMLLAGHVPVAAAERNWQFRIKKAPRRDLVARYTLGRFDREFMRLLLATKYGAAQG